MKHLVFKCRKCGYLIDIPEKTESVLCGKCGTWNRPHSIFAAIEQSAPAKQEEGSILQKVPGPVHSEIPDAFPVPETKDMPVPEEVKPAKPGLFSLVTLLFVIAPLASFITTKFNLPPATAFILIAAVIIAFTLMKKRS